MWSIEDMIVFWRYFFLDLFGAYDIESDTNKISINGQFYFVKKIEKSSGDILLFGGYSGTTQVH